MKIFILQKNSVIKKKKLKKQNKKMHLKNVKNN